MDTLSQKLPNDPMLWDKAILDALTLKVPKVAASIMAIDIKEADYQGGNLTAVIVAANGELLIPVVVRNFRLKPFDVALYGDRVVALTERTTSDILFSPEIASKKLYNYQDIQTYKDISQLLSPPNTGYGYGNISGAYATNKTASARISLIEAIGLSSDETKIKFASELLKNMDALKTVASLLPYKTILAKLEDVGTQKSASEKRSPTLYIKSTGSAYTVNGVVKSADEIQGLLSDDEVSELLLRKEILVGPEEGSEADITILATSGVVPLKNFTVANAVCANGDVVHGVFVPNVTTFDGESTYRGLFISGNKEWIYQENVIGNKIGGHDAALHIESMSEVEDDIKIGDYGVFVNTLNKYATEPFKVISVYSLSGTTLMSIATNSGQRLVVEYKKEYSTECPLRIVSGGLVSKYFPSDRVYAISNPYRYISLGAKKNGVRTPREAVVKSTGVCSPEKVIISIKKALDGGYVIKKSDYHADRDGQQQSKHSGFSKLACQYELTTYGLGLKQAKVAVGMAPVAFALSKAAIELPTRHYGAQLEQILPPSPRRLMTNGTEQGTSAIMDNSYIQAANRLQDPDMLNLLLTIGMSKIDDRVRSYVLSNLEDIQGAIDKLGRLLLIMRTSEEEGISEDVVSDVIQKLDRTVWELNDYFRQNQGASEDS